MYIYVNCAFVMIIIILFKVLLLRIRAYFMEDVTILVTDCIGIVNLSVGILVTAPYTGVEVRRVQVF